ncbi:MAG TPA: hypothetical protein VGR77_02510 [Candidatus Dormibacteraeota bacterium]|nr:hypothetical protein [Candidatus Dormibacteraeota bacterium]
MAFAADAITVTPASGTAITVDEGNNTGSKLVGKFTDTGNAPQPDVNCEELYVATINWDDGSHSTGTVSCERDTSSDHVPTGIFDVTGAHVYTDSASHDITVSVVDNSESAESSGVAVKTDTALVNDVPLVEDFHNANRDGSPFVKVEGESLTVKVAFSDDTNAFPVTEGPSFDPGITATIDWGDGSAVQSVTPTDPPVDFCDSCFGDAYVSGTHVYDATKLPITHYSIKVTAKDDGGSTATDNLTVNVSDAKLTAVTPPKTFVAAAAQASSPVVASFKDAAGSQAKAADYTATIKWGDGTSSSGTATQTAAGAFNVSGTHTYSSAGTKSLTITVTDEEGQGQTLSMTATATVPVLPTTGQPKTPLAPSLPLLPLIVMALGLIAIAGGVGRTLIREGRP